MFIQALLLVLSIVVLYYGAEISLNSAEKIGKALKLSSLTIGLVIVGFGTSLPELFVSHIACIGDHPGIALGNIVGSNVANLFLILGVAGLLVPLKINSHSVKRQFLLHFVLTILMTVVLLQSELYWYSAVVLLLFFAAYLYYTFVRMKKYHEGIELDDDETPEMNFAVFIKLVVGFGLLYLGGELLVRSGSTLGRELGISEYVISAIFVAFGTSFPELVTTLLACFKKKHTDLITGNIIGSNIFNVAMILGSLGGYKVVIDQSFVAEVASLLVASVFLIAWSYANRPFFRFAGALFIATYGVMIFYWVA